MVEDSEADMGAELKEVMATEVDGIRVDTAVATITLPEVSLAPIMEVCFHNIL